MNKTFKGAGAAVAAGVLLMGGAGSLAYWSDSDTFSGDSISSGVLSLTDVTAGTWTLNDIPVALEDEAALQVVPGDELVYSGTYTIGALGDNLYATVEASGGTGDGLLAEYVDTATVTAKIGETTVEEVTEENDGDELDVAVAVTFPFDPTLDDSDPENDGEAVNASQGLTLNLSDITVSLTQTDGSALL